MDEDYLIVDRFKNIPVGTGSQLFTLASGRRLLVITCGYKPLSNSMLRKKIEAEAFNHGLDPDNLQLYSPKPIPDCISKHKA